MHRLDRHRQLQRSELFSDKLRVLAVRGDHKREALAMRLHRATGRGRNTQASEAAKGLDHETHLVHFVVVKQHPPRRKGVRRGPIIRLDGRAGRRARCGGGWRSR